MAAYVQRIFMGVPGLPAGVNSTAVNADEFNGAGLDWASPALAQVSESQRVMVLTTEELAVFDCPSMVVGPENRRIGVAEQDRTIRMSKRCAA